MKLLKLLFEQIIHNYLIDNFKELTRRKFNQSVKYIQGIQGLTFSSRRFLRTSAFISKPKNKMIVQSHSFIEQLLRQIYFYLRNNQPNRALNVTIKIMSFRIHFNKTYTSHKVHLLCQLYISVFKTFKLDNFMFQKEFSNGTEGSYLVSYIPKYT